MRRDEDHLALFIELLGRMPKRISSSGKYAKDYFNRHGELRHIKKMRFWPLEKVLQEKYHLPEAEVCLIAMICHWWEAVGVASCKAIHTLHVVLCGQLVVCNVSLVYMY